MDVVRRINKNWVVLGVAVGIGLLAAFGAQRYFQTKQEELARGGAGELLKVVVASDDLPKGERLSQNNLAARAVPADFVQSGAVRPDQFEQIQNLKLAYPVRRGEFIMWSMLEDQNAAPFATRVSAGRRAVAVPVDEISSLSGMLQPGDRIDLFVSLQRHQHNIVTPLLENMLVLAAGDRVSAGSGEGAQRNYSTITLDASPDQASLLMLAKEAGKLNAVLRNPNDQTPLAVLPNLRALLMGIEEVKPTRPVIPVLVGGQSMPESTGAGAASTEAKSLQRLASALERLAPAPTSADGRSAPPAAVGNAPAGHGPAPAPTTRP
ncbi:Flp pilus assembly protein CpaB [Aquabacterium sp. A7-Y]|uniref:Flp pilus assembly protein CpaB n=1 Tax=Aquabacterium sp. A7-Y TaxID=1349605 RepID=UPI00223DF632|nr:Flp pilus assembly protein CpaB [Aquabacterium sp. A7-Y]MCW7540690.1 Flp pilus assembly protein CpaB [Aquabacterium sp. A7-Y]